MEVWRSEAVGQTVVLWHSRLTEALLKTADATHKFTQHANLVALVGIRSSMSAKMYWTQTNIVFVVKKKKKQSQTLFMVKKKNNKKKTLLSGDTSSANCSFLNDSRTQMLRIQLCLVAWLLQYWTLLDLTLLRVEGRVRGLKFKWLHCSHSQCQNQTRTLRFPQHILAEVLQGKPSQLMECLLAFFRTERLVHYDMRNETSPGTKCEFAGETERGGGGSFHEINTIVA